MKLYKYLNKLNNLITNDVNQNDWYKELKKRCLKGREFFRNSNNHTLIHKEFQNRIRTEELKAWYSSPENDSLFQGTSVSSLTIPCTYSSPLSLNNIEELEHSIADSYIYYHKKYTSVVKKSIVENVDNWINEGLYYGVVIASKVISQTFDLTIPYNNVVFQIDKYMVDPHEIISYPLHVREEYYKQVVKKIDCFENIDLSREEIESSLILADISKPRIEKYKSQIMLAPVRCNEIASLIAKNVTKLIKEKSKGEINPKSLLIVIYDTDTPYTYHHLLECNGDLLSPILPGLIILGTSGTIDAFRWLYAYRVSLISQKIQKGSLYSEAHKKFIPFVLFGVLVPRDAEILLEMNNLDKLRYRGNISPSIEFSYILPNLIDYINNYTKSSFLENLQKRLY